MMIYKLLSRISPEFSCGVVSLSGIGHIGQRIQRLGIPVEALEMHRSGAIFSVIPRLARFIRGIRPDVVHTWLYHADLIGGVAARLADVPAVCWNIRTSTPRRLKRSTFWVAQACALISHFVPDHMVCCSEISRRQHAAMGYDSSRFILIPNGFDSNLYCPDENARSSVRRELDIPASALLIGLIGRFHPMKDHRGFFHAAGKLHRSYPGVHFLLAGAGVDGRNQAIREWAREAGVSKVTRLLGFRDDIPRLTAALDIATNSSCYGEAFSNSIGEAMATGIPCVVTDVGDSAFIVGDGGLVVPAGDFAHMVEAWAKLIEMTDVERRTMGARARDRVTRYFGINSVVGRYEELYKLLACGVESRTGGGRYGPGEAGNPLVG